MLIASYLYALCQALDLRALQRELEAGVQALVHKQLVEHFGSYLAPADLEKLYTLLIRAVIRELEHTSTMDAAPRMRTVAAATTTPIVDFCAAHGAEAAMGRIPAFREQVAARATQLLEGLRQAYLAGDKGGAPASAFLGRTRAVYEYVRVTLGIRMHGSQNLEGFHTQEISIGQNISLIHEVCCQRFSQFQFEADGTRSGDPGWKDARHCCWAF